MPVPVPVLVVVVGGAARGALPTAASPAAATIHPPLPRLPPTPTHPPSLH